MDLLPSQICVSLGIKKVPLSWVNHENAQPAPVEEKVTNRVNGASYDTIMEELIAWTPQTGNDFYEENYKVFQIPQDMVNGKWFESSIEAYQKASNDKTVYHYLHQINLGSYKRDNILEDDMTYIMNI